MKKEKIISGLLVFAFLLTPSFNTLANTDTKVNNEMNSSNTINTKNEDNNKSESGMEVKTSTLSIGDYYKDFFNRDNLYEINGERVLRRVQYYIDGIGQVMQEGKKDKKLMFLSFDNNEVKISNLITAPNYRENLIGANTPSEVILKAPLKVNNKWTSNGNTYEITEIISDEKTEVIKVSKNDGNELLTFQKGVGLREVKIGNNIYLKFVGSSKPSSENTVVNLYFPGNILVETELSFNTNDSVRDLLNTAFKQIASNSKYTEVLGGSSEIQFMYFENDVVHVDLNDAFIEYINGNQSIEKDILESLVNTLCNAYKAKGVSITINDQRYESKGQKIEKNTILKPTVN